MSGHSKWSTIKHKKSLTDQNRGKLFSKLSKIITVVAREKGGDPDMNPRLRAAIEKAKVANMPTENIEKAIKKGTGEVPSATLEEFTYEAYGPGGIAMIIEGITDNKNRTFSEIKHLLAQHNSKMADSGSVLYMFDRMGKILAGEPQNRDEVELTAIDAGAEDIQLQNGKLVIYTKPENLYAVKNALEKHNTQIESTDLDWREKKPLPIQNEKIKQDVEKLLETLDEHDDVQTVYSNMKS